jgi:hypothetical protein
MGRVRQARRKGVREEPAFTSLKARTGPNLVDRGRERCGPNALVESGELLGWFNQLTPTQTETGPPESINLADCRIRRRPILDGITSEYQRAA